MQLINCNEIDEIWIESETSSNRNREVNLSFHCLINPVNGTWIGNLQSLGP